MNKAHFDGGTYDGGIYWGFQVYEMGRIDGNIGWSWILKFEQHGVSSHYKTNNESEYIALSKLLELLEKLIRSPRYEIYGDSKLVIEQMKGNWKVKANNLLPLWKKCKTISDNYNKDELNYHHCPREEPLQKAVDMWARGACR